MGQKSRVKVVLNDAGFAELLKSYAVQADLDRRAQTIAEAAGPGMEVEADPTGERGRAKVHTATFAARRAEATDRTLTRAIDAGR